MKKADIQEFFTRLRAVNPEPKTELESLNDFTFLVAVVLSAQATDKGVNKATAALFPLADTPEKMLALGEAGLTGYIKTIGLYKAKAKNVIALSRMLIEIFDGALPSDRESLMRLPGVGRKTANVVLNNLYGQPTIAVDTHIFRVSNRTGLAPGPTVERVEEKLDRVVPDEFRLNTHHWLILHGRYICKARKPECAVCPVYYQCGYAFKTV